MNRDMTADQFRAALKRYGMTEGGFLGYIDVNVPGHHLHVCRYNAGKRHRDQLAYLLAERDRSMRECKCGHMSIDHSFKHLNPQAGHGATWGCCRTECRETCLEFVGT